MEYEKYDVVGEDMLSKIKVTVSVDERLVRELHSASRRTHKPRSQLVEEALRLWRRQQLARALRDAYRAMASEDRASAERQLAAGWDAIK
jgi:metal-responsive CopG/Arc/MetJ family transcriptional regulator